MFSLFFQRTLAYGQLLRIILGQGNNSDDKVLAVQSREPEFNPSTHVKVKHTGMSL